MPVLSQFENEYVDNMPKFYQHLLSCWAKISTAKPLTASSILSESIWNNTNLLIDEYSIKSNIFGKNYSKTLFVNDFFKDGKIIPWDSFHISHNIKNQYRFKWMQIMNCIPQEWKTHIKMDAGNSVHFCVFIPHLLFWC